jgi:hypothetical protein
MTEKKTNTQKIARMIPIQPVADRMEPQAVRFTDIIPESAIFAAMF